MATILIVDDRPTNRQFLVTLLSYSGHRLMEAANGADALALTRVDRFDLIITDIMMPTMDGFELAQRLRQNPEYASTPIIFYTATFREPEAWKMARECGVQEVITKPAEPPAILEKVNRLLGLRPPEPSSPSKPLPEVELRQETHYADSVNRNFLSSLQKLEQTHGELSGLVSPKRISISDHERMAVLVGESASLLSSLHQVGLRLISFIKLSTNMITEQDSERVLASFCEGARVILGARSMLVTLLAADERTVVKAFLSTMNGQQIFETSPEWLLDGRLDAVITARCPVRSTVHGTGMNGEPPQGAAGWFLDVPILTASQLYGVASFFDKHDVGENGPGAFSLEDEQLAATLATEFAILYENRQWYDQLQRHTTTLQLEVSQRKKMQAQLAARERQQSAILELEQFALRGPELQELLDQFASVLAQTLDMTFCQVWEILPDGQTMRLSAGAGWPVGVVGQAMESIADDTLAAYTLRTNELVLMTDLVSENRFRPGPLLENRSITSGMSVVLSGPDQPFGVLSILTQQPRTFTADEIDFLKSVANVLAVAVERKRAEILLRQNEARLRRLVESNIIGILFRDEQGQIQDANQAFLSIVGYTAEELKSGIRWTDLTPQEYEPLDRASMEEARRRGACTPYEKEYIRKDGSRVPVLIGYTLMEGSVSDYVAFVLDLRALKRVEAEAREYALKLERSNRELQDFAFIASHDLQEPLRKVKVFGQRLQEHLGDRIQAEEMDYLERMIKASERMQTMINELLAYSRVTTKAQPFVRVDLTAILRGVTGDLEIQLEHTRGQVVFGNFPSIEADRLQMHQLFLNLIGNALKFHRPEVPPVVQVSARQIAPAKHPQTGLRTPEELVEIEVTDNGIGFDMDQLERIFKPFERLHGKSEYQGFGMGLAICRKIVEHHRGTLTAQSQPGSGSTFIITLPMNQLSSNIGSDPLERNCPVNPIVQAC